MSQAAIDLVLALFKDPGLVAEFRDRALPGDIGQVIRIAAGESAAMDTATETTGESAETLGEACVFYLQQMLFAPGADSYRVLGARFDDPQERLREHYRWLMKWLHPDRNQDGWEAVYAERVTTAWQDLKTPERRAEYDERALPVSLPMVPVTPAGWRRPLTDHAPRGPLLSGRIVRNLPGIVLGSLAGLAMLMVATTYWARSTTERRWVERESREPQHSEAASVALAAPEGGMAPADANPLPAGRPGPSAEGEMAALAWEDEPSRSVAVLASPMPPTLAQPQPAAEAPAAPDAADTLVVTALESDPATRSGDPAIARPAPAQDAAPGDSAADTVAVAALPPPPPPAQTLVVVTRSSSAPPAAAQDPVQLADAGAVDRESPPRLDSAPEPTAEPPAAEVASVESPLPGAPMADSGPAESLPFRREQAPPAARPELSPAQGSAEELVREFVAAYAAGDLGRFDRLVSASGRNQPALADMRRRFDTTDMRFLEISQVQWRLGEGTAQAFASFRDTYVPRGSRRAVTEAGRIAWEIRVEDGNHRIAGLARNAAR